MFVVKEGYCSKTINHIQFIHLELGKAITDLFPEFTLQQLQLLALLSTQLLRFVPGHHHSHNDDNGQ